MSFYFRLEIAAPKYMLGRGVGMLSCPTLTSQSLHVVRVGFGFTPHEGLPITIISNPGSWNVPQPPHCPIKEQYELAATELEWIRDLASE